MQAILMFLRGVEFGDELEDDRFCEELAEKYENDPDKGQLSLIHICSRPMGQASMQRPQRMQAEGSGRAAACLLNSSRPLFCLSTGKSALGAAAPIIGPPKMILPSSTPSLMPPQASITSRYSVCLLYTSLGA